MIDYYILYCIFSTPFCSSGTSTEIYGSLCYYIYHVVPGNEVSTITTSQHTLMYERFANCYKILEVCNFSPSCRSKWAYGHSLVLLVLHPLKFSSLTWVSKMSENWWDSNPSWQTHDTIWSINACILKFAGWTCQYEWAFGLPKVVIFVYIFPLPFPTNPQITLSWSVLLLDTTDNLIAKVKDNNATIISTLETLNLSTFLYDELLIMLNGYYGM